MKSIFFTNKTKTIRQNILSYWRQHVFQLRFLKFILVGATGVGVNMGILYTLTEGLHLHYAISSLFAIELSILSNFTLNDRWTWRDRQKKHYLMRLFQYHLSVGITAIAVNWGLLIVLTEFVGLYYLVSNLLGIAAGTLLNYTLNDLWTFRKPFTQ